MTTELFDYTGRVYASLDYDLHNKWVVCTWLGAQTATSVLLGSNACVLMLEQHACCCLLNDSRQLLGIWNDDVMDLLIAHWGPRVIKAGLTHLATVMLPDSVAALYEEVLQFEFATRLRMRHFDQLLLAQQWLRESKPTA